MKARILAQAYAKAFIEYVDGKHYEDLLTEQKILRKVFKDNPKLSQMLKSHFVPQQVKKEILDAIISKTANRTLWQRLFYTILQKKRETIIVEVLKETERMLFIKLDKVKMILLLARKHRENTLNKIKNYFENKLSKEIIMEIELDPSILGGFVAYIGNTSIDGSIRNTLERFQSAKVV